MTIRTGIMEYVRRAIAVVDTEHRRQLREFIVSQIAGNGGFLDRDGKADLYYTVFGMQLLEAAGVKIPFERVSGFLQRFYQEIAFFDLLEVASLGRCLGMLPLDFQFGAVRDKVAERIHAFVSDDGSFAMTESQRSGSIYAAFIAVGALQDMDLPIDNSQAVISNIESLALADGSYVNDHNMPIGLVPSTAAAIVLLNVFGSTVSERAFQWLLSCTCPGGGFAAVPGGSADLLSTAVAMYALKQARFEITGLGRVFHDAAAFADEMKADNGGYYGSPDDKILDCEYCYYGLLIKGLADILH